MLYHISTAFVHTTADGDRGRTAIGYASSKSAAEEVVRSGGVRHVILRPSVVIGDSGTGEITAFQGLHQVVAGLFAGIVPMIPFDPAWPIDFVPADVVADTIACVVENRVSEGEFWISAGDRALRLDEGVAVVVEFARGLGVRIDMPRFVPPDMFDRLIGPVFLDALPGKIRRNVLRMLEFFTIYLQSGQTKPSSLDQLGALGALGARPLRTIRLRLHVPNKPASDVYQTLADFERYPELSDAVQSVAVTEVSENRTVSQWEATFRAGLLCWTEEDSFDPGARTITFRQLEGDAAVFDGSWQCVDASQGSEIVFSARLDMGIPSLADALEPIAVRTLIDNIVSIVRGLVGSAEVVASDVAVPVGSGS